MELPSLKELSKIIKLCRKTGVKVFELDGLRITLTDEVPATRAGKAQGPQAPKTSQQAPSVPDSLPTPEDLLFWSAGGPPEAEDSMQ